MLKLMINSMTFPVWVMSSNRFISSFLRRLRSFSCEWTNTAVNTNNTLCFMILVFFFFPSSQWNAWSWHTAVCGFVFYLLNLQMTHKLSLISADGRSGQRVDDTLGHANNAAEAFRET